LLLFFCWQRKVFTRLTTSFRALADFHACAAQVSNPGGGMVHFQGFSLKPKPSQKHFFKMQHKGVTIVF
jgi:hypothetical protein